MAVSVLYSAVLNNESSKTEWHPAIAKGGKGRGQFGKKFLPIGLARFDIKAGLVGETENGKLLLQE